MRPVVVTGISGFVGRHVAKALIDLGLPVRGLVRNRSRIGLPLAETVELYEGDLANSNVLSDLTRGAAAVVHCGGAIRAKSRAEFLATNATGTERIVEAAERSGVERFVHVSSLAAREPHLSHYAQSKRASEDAVVATVQHMTWIVVRPSVVYGPGDRATLPLVAALTRRSAWLPGTTDARFSLVHVADLARALAMLTIGAVPHAATFEVDDGTRAGYGWRDLETAATAINGRATRVVLIPKALLTLPVLAARVVMPFMAQAPLLSAGKLNELYHPDWVARGLRLESACDWRPQRTLEAGLSETIDWYRRNGWLPQRDGQRRSVARDAWSTGHERT
jgi:nucleoside-diphosphate-sugar epimerase